ncbi:MAG TPA: nucleotidyltransferase domain-containing protein [Thermoanaerobaculia bacterium]
MTIEALPQPVRDTLDGLVVAAQRAFGDDLRAIVLYGSAAEGRMRATSDVNVAIVLLHFVEERADQFREPFRFAAAAIAVKAMFLLEDEIDDAAKEFAQKFADIARRRRVLYGDDPFAHLDIPREALITRVQQVLLNLTLRLRQNYVERSLREEQCALTVAEVAGPLRTSAAAILELEGRGRLPPKESLETLAAELGGYQKLLPHLSEARERRALPRGHAAEILFATLGLAQALYGRAKKL